jgi:hypothetical protein
MRTLLFFLVLSSVALGQQGLVPFSSTPRTDKLGNEWNLEQNGMVNRPNSGNSIISGCGALMIGNQQFYTNQPMATADGKEIVLQSSQPLMGFNVTRRIRYLEKEGGLRYLEQFTNTLGRDTTITVEIRHSFSGGARGFITDKARPYNGKLEASESGIIILPGQGNNGSPALLCTVSAPRGTDKPRISGRNQYQLSFFHTLTVPAGKSATLLHTMGQAKTSLSPDEEELQRLFRPLAFSRMVKEIPRDLLPTVANLKNNGAPEGMATWFPSEYWGIKPETFDVLAIGDSTRLKGKAQCTRLTLKHELGETTLPWEEVRALAGSRFIGQGRACVWLKDGERWIGEITATDLKFTLVSGLSMDLQLADLDRLIIAGTVREKWPEDIAALIETQAGERLALTDASSSLPMTSIWGDWSLRIADLIHLTAPEDGALTGLARLRDGTRIRLMPGSGSVTLPIKRFGPKALPLSSIQQAATAEIAKPLDDTEAPPTQSYADLSGDQRLIGRITAEKIRLTTTGGLVQLSPASIREMRDITEEQDTPPTDEGRVYQTEIWGGGTVVGQSADSQLRIEGKDYAWTLPMRHLLRFGNPVPKIESAVMARIGTLIRDLGDEDWSKREQASRELRELGPLSRPSLQEALKQATDPEVTRRIEEITQEMDSL